MRDKNPHSHAEPRELATDTLLSRNVTPRKVVIFQGSKPLIVHEPKLVDEVVARVMTKHPEMRRVV